MIPLYEKGEIGDHADTFFLIMNPVGITGNAINSIMLSLSNCYTTKINYLDNIQIYLIIAGLCVLIFSFVGIMIASIAADKSINYLWEHFRNKILDAYAELSQNITSRLKDYHEETETFVDVLEFHQYKKAENVNFKHSMRYFINFLPLFLVVGGLYCVLVLPVFNSTQYLLEVKPKLIFSVNDARLGILDIYFWTTESILADTELRLNNVYNGFVLSPDIVATDISLINHLHSIRELFSLPEIRPLLSDQVYSELYQAYPNTSYYLDMGILSAMDIYGIESLFIINVNATLAHTTGMNYLLLATDLTIILRKLSFAIYGDSNNYIQADLNNFLIYVGGFCICLILAYLLYYYPYSRNEEKVLRTLKKLMKNIPSVAIKKSKAARTHKILLRKGSSRNLE